METLARADKLLKGGDSKDNANEPEEGSSQEGALVAQDPDTKDDRVEVHYI